MKISVAMAYYNGGTYIEEQMDSILSQLGNQDEVIVSVHRNISFSSDNINLLCGNGVMDMLFL